MTKGLKTKLFTGEETDECEVIQIIRNKHQKFKVKITEHFTSYLEGWESDKMTYTIIREDEKLKLSPRMQKQIVQEAHKKLYHVRWTYIPSYDKILCE